MIAPGLVGGVDKSMMSWSPGAMVPCSARKSRSIARSPELLAEQDDRHALHAAGLDQRQRLEELVQRAEAAGKHRDRLGAQEEVHLADGEIVEVEAELRRHVGVRRLLVRQHDVEPDRGRADIVRAAVAGLHDARPAAGDDDEFAVVGRGRVLRAEPREVARLLVVDAVGFSRFFFCVSFLAAQASPPGSGMRAPPNSTTVERMPRSARIISGFSSSSCRRTARSSRRVRNSSSSQASR